MELHEELWKLSRRLYRKRFIRLAKTVKGCNFFLHHCLLPFEAAVGEGVRLEHYGLGVVIHPQVEIGSSCRIYHHVTLAAETWIGSPHRIVLDEGVTIGAHSIVVARSNRTLHIGAGAIVGAGSVVITDVGAGEIWGGNPARKLKGRI